VKNEKIGLKSEVETTAQKKLSLAHLISLPQTKQKKKPRPPPPPPPHPTPIPLTRQLLIQHQQTSEGPDSSAHYHLPIPSSFSCDPP